MRGTLSLFTNIFSEETPAPIKKKGRSAEHNARRNELLIDRYYFKGKFTEKRYDIILSELENEFFLSQYTIPDIIADNIAQLGRLKQLQPSVSYFKKKWPHLVW